MKLVNLIDLNLEIKIKNIKENIFLKNKKLLKILRH